MGREFVGRPRSGREADVALPVFPAGAPGLLGRWIGSDYDSNAGILPDLSGNGNDGAEQLVGTASLTVTDGVLEVSRSSAIGNAAYFDLTTQISPRHLFFVTRYDESLDVSGQGLLIGSVYGSVTNTSFIFLARDGLGYAISVDGSSADTGEAFDDGVSLGSGTNIGPADYNSPDTWRLWEIQYDAGGPFDSFAQLLALDNNGSNLTSLLGGFAEALCFSGILSAADRLDVLQYLRARWAHLI